MDGIEYLDTMIAFFFMSIQCLTSAYLCFVQRHMLATGQSLFALFFPDQ